MPWVEATVLAEIGVEALTPAERARVESLEEASRRLNSLTKALDEEGPVTEGSRGQRRANGLLQRELELRRHVEAGFLALVTDVRDRAEREARAQRFAKDDELQSLLGSLRS